jgi:DNA-binding LacI/PurR family transcriptional regulator
MTLQAHEIKKFSSSGKRKTIAFMISSELENSFHVPIWKGVSEIAQEQGVNLVTFLNAPVWYSKDLLHHNETLYKQINRTLWME